MTSACGVCGSASIEAVRTTSRYAVAQDPLVLSPDVVAGLPEALRARQPVFERTGGLHAAGLATASGELLLVREDVGRHNAVDKVVGAAARERALPLSGTVLVVSARASFEIVQKASVAGIPAVVGRRRPDLAGGRPGRRSAASRSSPSPGPPRFSVYARPDRVTC